MGCVDCRLVSEPTGWRRGFWSLIVTQFQGAFSDNALKQLAIFVGISLGLSQTERDQLVSLATALLTLAPLRGISAGSFLVCSNVVDAPATQWTADEHRAAFLTAAPVALSALLSEPKPK